MSSTSSTTPDHRLVFDGMTLTLYAPGSPEPLAIADLAAPDMSRQVADLAKAAEASPCLTVVLPEAEVWRGELRLGSRTPWGRRAEALAEAEVGTGVGRDALDIVVGPRAADGAFPVAAIRRQSVVDTLVFLDRTGLRASALTGGGDFPGFDAVPLFRIGGRDWPAKAVTVMADVANRLPLITRPQALAASGAAALLLLALTLSGGEDTTPVPVATTPVVSDVIFPVVETPEAAPAVLMQPLAPRARPADLKPVSEPVEATLPPLPPALRPAGPTDARPVTIASRTPPIAPVARTTARHADITLAAAPAARVRTGPAQDDTAAGVTPPSPASTQAPAEVSAAETTSPNSIDPTQAAEPASAEDPTPAVSLSATRPVPRSKVVMAETLAETVPSTLETVETPETTRPPLATAALLPAAAPPEPRRLVSTAPTPIAVRAAVLAASAVPEPKPVATPKPMPVAVAKPEPVVVAKAAPAAKWTPVRKTAAPTANRAASERVGLSRSSVSLLGVFGSSKDRYALLRLPNGSVKRVGAGDSVQGVRVAAVSRDSVRLTQGKRDTVLRMPD